jgi:hypothetical protein
MVLTEGRADSISSPDIKVNPRTESILPAFNQPHRKSAGLSAGIGFANPR